MPIYSSQNARIALAPPPPLPPALDVVLNYLPAGDPNWKSLFEDFINFIYQRGIGVSGSKDGFAHRKSGLCDRIFEGWLKHLVEPNSSGDWVFKSGITVTNRAELFQALDNVLTSKPQCELFMLIGLYHFVIWLLSNKDSSAMVNLSPAITNYIKLQLVNHEYSDSNPDYDIIWDPSKALATAFPSSFEMGFNPGNSLIEFTFKLQDIRPLLLFKKGAVSLPAFSAATPQEKMAIKAAMHSFIKKARGLLDDMVHSEVLSVLSAIRPALVDRYGRLEIMAVGLGQATYGFFGIRNFGILFFNYELLGRPSDTDFEVVPTPTTIAELQQALAAIEYLGVNNDRTWEGKKYSSVFVSHVGIDRNFNAEYAATLGDPPRRNSLIPHVKVERFDADGSTERTVLHAVNHEGYSFNSDADAELYARVTSEILLSESQSVQLQLVTNKSKATGALADSELEPATLAQEELAFFLFPNNVARMSALASASTFWLLDDNLFWKDISTINQEVFRPGGTVDTGLDAVIAELVFGADFKVTATLLGQGVGRVLDDAETTATGPTVARDSNQTDRPIPNASSDNNLLRYAHGRMTYSADESGGTLAFRVVAFASPLHCTWETKLVKSAQMHSEVGRCLELDQGRIWYNGALSAFRAFGFFKAMIAAIDNRIDELSVPGADLDLAAPQIRQKLDDYLTTQARVQIKTQSGNPVKKKPPDPPVELVVDNLLFNKFI